MTRTTSEQAEELARLELQYLHSANRTARPVASRSIPVSELPEATTSALANEWNFYRRIVARLLAEGHENRWVLIRGEEIVGVWEDEEEAERERLNRFPWQSALLKQVLTREPVYRVRGPSGQWH